eukprot:COSAG01_NODE_2309_length_7942_cov_7.425602_9_plen_67_part_00
MEWNHPGQASAAFGQGIIHQWFWWRLEAASPGLRRARTLLAAGSTAAAADVCHAGCPAQLTIAPLN